MVEQGVFVASEEGEVVEGVRLLQAGVGAVRVLGPLLFHRKHMHQYRLYKPFYLTKSIVLVHLLLLSAPK